MKKFLKENKWNIVAVTILTLIIYIYRLCNNGFSVDTEVMINNPQGQMLSWMITGRWSLYFTKYIFHLVPINIPLTNILAITFLILSSIIWTYYLESISSIKNYKCNWMFMSAFVSSPILCEQIGFTLQAFEIIFGLFMMAISMILIESWMNNQKNVFQLIGAIIIIIYCFGLYQSFIFLFVFMCILSFVLKYEYIQDVDLKKASIEILKYIGIFLITFVLFELVSKLVLSYLGVDSGTYLYDQVLWGKESLVFIIKNIVLNIIYLIIGEKSLYHFFLLVFMIIFFIRYCFDQTYNLKTRIFKMILILLLYVAPFALNIVLGGKVTVRTLFSLCFLNCFLIWNGMLKEKSKILMIIIVVSLLMPSGVTFLLNRSAANCYNEEVKMANQITEMIKEKNYQDKKVIFIGKYNPNSMIQGELLGVSFFEWDYSSSYQCNGRIFGFLDAINIHYNKASIEDMHRIIPKTTKLKSWKDKKQIYLIDDVVVIKLS